MTHKGSCHCGNVAIEVEGDIQGVIQCNCSICHRKGAPLWFVPKGNAMAAINVRCLEGVELDSIHITPYNGRAL